MVTLLWFLPILKPVHTASCGEATGWITKMLFDGDDETKRQTASLEDRFSNILLLTYCWRSRKLWSSVSANLEFFPQSIPYSNTKCTSYDPSSLLNFLLRQGQGAFEVLWLSWLLILLFKTSSVSGNLIQFKQLSYSMLQPKIYKCIVKT